MKNIISIATPFLFVSLFGQFSQAYRCEALFSAASGVSIVTQQLSEKTATLNLSESAPNLNHSDEAITIIRHALQSTSFNLSDKNFLYKDEIVLGYNLKNDYSLEVGYKSDSRFTDKFVINEISIVSPTGYKTRLAKDLFLENNYELKQSQFDLSRFFEKGAVAEVNIPFFIQGKTLEILSKYVKDLELFNKNELRDLFASSSSSTIKHKMLFKRAQAIFHDVLIKQPFKIFIGAAIAFSVMTFKDATNVERLQYIPVVGKILNKQDTVRFEYSTKENIKYEVIAKEIDSTRIDYVVQPMP